MFVDETFPLWAVSSLEKGGLAWSSARVGAALAAMGCGMVVYQMALYEPLIQRCCTRGPAATFAALCAASAAAIAVLHESARRARVAGDGAVLYGVVVVILFVYRAAATSAFTTLGLVVNASVGRDQVRIGLPGNASSVARPSYIQARQPSLARDQVR